MATSKKSNPMRAPKKVPIPFSKGTLIVSEAGAVYLVTDEEAAVCVHPDPMTHLGESYDLGELAIEENLIKYKGCVTLEEK